MEDRSKRAETVRPQHDEHCERQFVCDSALSAKIDGNDIELNSEADDEDMEDGEGVRRWETFVTQANRLPANTEST